MVADPLRVSVVSGPRRRDLAVPGALPVAELLPLVVEALGEQDVPGCSASPRLTTADGRPLDGELGLAVQGVLPAAVLGLSWVRSGPGTVHDDVAEALAAVLADGRRSTQPATYWWWRVTSLALAAGIVALALVLHPDPRLARPLAVVVAAVLLTCAVLASRARAHLAPDPGATGAPAGEGDPAVPPTSSAAPAGTVVAPAAALLGCGFAGLAAYCGWVERTGSALITSGSVLAGAGPSVGAALIGAGLVALIGLAAGRPLLLPPIAVGAAVAGGGLATRAGVDPTAVAAVLACGGGLAGSWAPGAALAVAGRDVPALLDPDDDVPSSSAAARPPRHRQGGTRTVRVEPDAPRAVDLDLLRRDALLADDALAGIAGATGALLLLAVPLLAASGVAAELLAGVLGTHTLLRARRTHAARVMVLQAVCGLGALTVLLATVALLDPGSRGVLAGLAATVLLGLLLPMLRDGTGRDGASAPTSGGMLRRRRAADLAETACVLAIVPLLVLTLGLPRLVVSALPGAG